MMLELLYRQAG